MRMTTWLAAALFAASASLCSPATAQKTSDLPAASSVTGTDQVAISTGSGCATHVTPCATQRATLAQIATFAGASLDAKLVAIAGLSPSADTCFYFTSSTAVASYSCPSFGRSIATSSSASAARTTLGLVIGTNVQAWDADLDALAALTGTNTIYYRSASNTWSSVTIGTNLTFSGGTLSATGGSGIAPPASPAADDFLQYKSGAWTNRTIAQVKADLGLPQSADVQIFNVSGTWTKPAFGSTTRVIVWGGGGGGGNGGVAAAGTGVSGGGGGGGVFGIDRTFQTSVLGSTETVTVGAGGAIHSAGGNSSFGSWATSYGGGGGSDGASGVNSGGGGSGSILLVGNNASGGTGGASNGIGGAAGGSGAGGAASNFGSGGGGTAITGVPGAGGFAGTLAPGSSGGGGGGAIAATDIPTVGGTGGGNRAQGNSGTGAAGGAIGNNAGTTPSNVLPLNEGGGGGGGGGAGSSSNGGAGANGQAPGGGAGGGGAARTGFSGGAGGVGGAGRVIVITI